MKRLFKSIQLLFAVRGNIGMGRAFKELDKSGILGENVPYSVLAYFSRDGV